MAQSGLHVPAHDRAAAGVPLGVRGHRRRAVDRGQPQHVLGAHHQSGVDGPRAAAAGAGPARRGRNRHRSERGRRAGHGAGQSFPPARRAPDRDHPLRRGEDVGHDHRGRDGRGVRLRSADLRADLSAGLRRARPQPGDRDGAAARDAARRWSPRRAGSSATTRSACRRTSIASTRRRGPSMPRRRAWTASAARSTSRRPRSSSATVR